MDVNGYLSTYSRYNSGNLCGGWITIDDGATRDEIGAAMICHLIATRSPQELTETAGMDEAELIDWAADQEPMWQDWDGEGLARLLGETPTGAQLEALADMSEDDWGHVCAAADALGWHYIAGDIAEAAEKARECYCGDGRDLADYAAEYAEQAGYLEHVPREIAYCIDWAQYARDYLDSLHVYDGRIYDFGGF